MTTLLLIIHRPHCQQFSLQLFSTGEIVPMKTVDGRFCRLPWVMGPQNEFNLPYFIRQKSEIMSYFVIWFNQRYKLSIKIACRALWTTVEHICLPFQVQAEVLAQNVCPSLSASCGFLQPLNQYSSNMTLIGQHCHAQSCKSTRRNPTNPTQSHSVHSIWTRLQG